MKLREWIERELEAARTLRDTSHGHRLDRAWAAGQVNILRRLEAEVDAGNFEGGVSGVGQVGKRPDKLHLTVYDRKLDNVIVTGIAYAGTDVSMGARLTRNGVIIKFREVEENK